VGSLGGLSTLLVPGAGTANFDRFHYRPTILPPAIASPAPAPSLIPRLLPHSQHVRPAVRTLCLLVCLSACLCVCSFVCLFVCQLRGEPVPDEEAAAREGGGLSAGQGPPAVVLRCPVVIWAEFDRCVACVGCERSRSVALYCLWPDPAGDDNARCERHRHGGAVTGRAHQGEARLPRRTSKRALAQ
jgi:hypothetical protein